ncbi:MAG TPA: endo-1,4-beta-xylanase, partial [Anaerolineales bacterium]|nr:endo-1,4-beta-xylanase [Anaerolineales bacterium]
PPAEKLAAQAELYGLIAAGCLAAPNCDTLVVWGLTDDKSWISGYTGKPDAPVLFDAAYQPKPAYETLRKLLEGR